MAIVKEQSREIFTEYLENISKIGQEEIILRFAFERPNDDEVPTPYYVWVSYTLNGEPEITIYNPDFSSYQTYLETPPEIVGKWCLKMNKELISDSSS